MGLYQLQLNTLLSIQAAFLPLLCLSILLLVYGSAMRVLILCVLTICLSSPTWAQSKKELAAQDAALAERLFVLESRMLTGDPAAERLMQRMDALETSQRTLTGEVERLRYERDQLRAEVKALNDDIRGLQDLALRTQTHLDAVDMVGQRPTVTQPQAPYIYDGAPNAGMVQDNRFMSGGVVDPSQPSPVPGPPVMKEMTIPIQGDFEALKVLPAQGKQKLAEGDFTAAQNAFAQYLNAIPDAPDAGEVSFWLGETYYVKQAYADAADAYISSMRKDPKGVKAPDAMVRLAAALRELGKTQEACQTLDSFPAQYPNAPANVRERARTELARTGC